MTISVGDMLPEATFATMGEEGPKEIQSFSLWMHGILLPTVMMQ